MFRGREVTHPERGTAILDRLAEELAELGVVEQRPMQEGRNMTMMMAPSKAVLAGRVGEGELTDEAAGDGEGPPAAGAPAHEPQVDGAEAGDGLAVLAGDEQPTLAEPASEGGGTAAAGTAVP
jgi:translation initiation factor IF-3